MNATQAGTQVLDRARGALDESNPAKTLDRMLTELDHVRRAATPESWKELVAECRRGHPTLDRLRSSPLTGRAFHKPRGYAGDAETLDYIYGGRFAPEQVPDTLRGVYEWEYSTGSCRSVRARRDLLRDVLDQTALEFERPRALSVACGHLREAHDSAAVRFGRLGELTALDQDSDSLARVATEMPPDVVRPVQASVRHLLGRRVDLPPQHLVYSAGLFDYLEPDVGRALTERMFELLTPGGRLVVVNFASSLPDVGYMEAVMDWHLVYRNEGDMRGLLDRIDPDALGTVSVRRLCDRNLVVLDVRRAEAERD